jgi:hypothetical protein
MKAFLRRLPLIRDYLLVRDAAATLVHGQRNQLAREAQEVVRQILATERYRDPRRLNGHEAQVFSQSGEDGIIGEIFRRIGPAGRRFVEIGVGNGLENNTAYLLAQGWSGSWLEGSAHAVREARHLFRRPLAASRLAILETMVTAEGVVPALESLGVSTEFDLLSVDVDRNTYYVWEALAGFRPRVVVVEYNSTIPPSDEWVVEYDASKLWNGTNYFGASLKSYELLGRRLGYVLVGCGLAGTNAFFVREDLAVDHFLPPYTAETHYEPPRYWLARVRHGHRRCFAD